MDTTKDTPPTTIVVSNNCTAVVPSNLDADTSYLNEQQHALQIHNFMVSSPIQTILDRISELDEEDSSLLALVPYSPIGYVYAAWNPLFQDLIKIGATMRQSPYTRVKELSTSGVPEPFQLVASISCKDPFALERTIHAHYDSVRKFGRKKEFFMISRDEVVDFFHAKSIEEAFMVKRPNTYTKRKHRRSLDTNHVFLQSVESFIKARLTLEPRAFVPATAIKTTFLLDYAGHTPSDKFIFQAIKRHIQEIFKGSAIYMKSAQPRGYKGIALK